jgi:predicted DNA-binding transcriptional regulator AlpA
MSKILRTVKKPDLCCSSCDKQQQPIVVSPADKPSPLLLPHQAAALCFKSVRTWRAWDSGGLIPQPIRIGRSTFWNAEELHAWMAAGCPRRADWALRKEDD